MKGLGKEVLSCSLETRFLLLLFIPILQASSGKLLEKLIRRSCFVEYNRPSIPFLFPSFYLIFIGLSLSLLFLAEFLELLLRKLQFWHWSIVKITPFLVPFLPLPSWKSKIFENGIFVVSKYITRFRTKLKCEINEQPNKRIPRIVGYLPIFRNPKLFETLEDTFESSLSKLWTKIFNPVSKRGKKNNLVQFLPDHIWTVFTGDHRGWPCDGEERGQREEEGEERYVTQTSH